MTLLVLCQNLLGALIILLIDHAQHLVVHNLSRSLRVRLLELILCIVIVAHIGQLLAHTGKGNHAVCLLGDTLQVVHRASRDMPHEEFLSSTTSQERAHFVEHSLLGLEYALLWQIPGCAKRLTTRHDAYLHQRIGKLREPRDRGVTSLVDSDGALLGLCHHLGLLLQTSDDTVYCIEEVLLLHRLRVMARSDQGCLITYIGDIGTRETWCLTGEEVDIHTVVCLHRLQMHLEHLLTLVEVRQIDVDLAIETSSTQQGRVEHVSTVRGCEDNHT